MFADGSVLAIGVFSKLNRLIEVVKGIFLEGFCDFHVNINSLFKNRLWIYFDYLHKLQMIFDRDDIGFCADERTRRADLTRNRQIVQRTFEKKFCSYLDLPMTLSSNNRTDISQLFLISWPRIRKFDRRHRPVFLKLSKLSKITSTRFCDAVGLQ